MDDIRDAPIKTTHRALFSKMVGGNRLFLSLYIGDKALARETTLRKNVL